MRSSVRLRRLGDAGGTGGGGRRGRRSLAVPRRRCSSWPSPCQRTCELTRVRGRRRRERGCDGGRRSGAIPSGRGVGDPAGVGIEQQRRGRRGCSRPAGVWVRERRVSSMPASSAPRGRSRSSCTRSGRRCARRGSRGCRGRGVAGGARAVVDDRLRREAALLRGHTERLVKAPLGGLVRDLLLNTFVRVSKRPGAR